MKFPTLVVLALLACALPSCKKNTQSPSIVGKWQLSVVSGTYATKSTPASTQVTTSYAYSDGLLTETDTTSTLLITVNGEIWTFNNDGTVNITEDYQSKTATVPNIDTITGWWDYTSSTTANSNVVLRTIVTPTLLPTGGAFFIQSVNGIYLILTIKESNTSSFGSSTDRDLTLTFTRQ